MRELLETIHRELQQLIVREEVLESLHRRLAHHEQDQHTRTFLEPLCRDASSLIRRTRDQVALLERQSNRKSLSQDRRAVVLWCAKSLQAVAIELEGLLERFGIEPFASDGNRFDRARQTVAAHVPHPDSSRAGSVARRLAPGYQINGQVLIPERVAVFCLPQPAQPQVLQQEKQK